MRLYHSKKSKVIKSAVWKSKQTKCSHLKILVIYLIIKSILKSQCSIMWTLSPVSGWSDGGWSVLVQHLRFCVSSVSAADWTAVSGNLATIMYYCMSRPCTNTESNLLPQNNNQSQRDIWFSCSHERWPWSFWFSSILKTQLWNEKPESRWCWV